MDEAVWISGIVILVRLVAPLALIRWPIGGVFINMLADTLDHEVLERVGWGLFTLGGYQHIDKILDTWYLFIIFLVLNKWQDKRAKDIGRVLFFWRFLGVMIFEFTSVRKLLVFAPNAFEYYYLIVAILQKHRPQAKTAFSTLLLILVAVTSVQFAREYMMHWKYPDVPFLEVLKAEIF